MAVILAEHRLERCLAAADRVVAMADGEHRLRRRRRPGSASGRSRGDPALATPGARLFSLAGVASAARSRSRRRAALALTGRRTGAPSVAASSAADRRRRRARPRPRASEPALQRAGPLGRARRRPERREVLRGVVAGDRARRAGGADGPQRRRQEHPAAGRRRPRRARSRHGSPRRAAARCCRRAPADLFVRERVGDELAGRAGRRARCAASASVGGRRATRATSRAASASGSRWRS